MSFAEDVIINYGYYAVFFFACIEGEVALLVAGFLCSVGYLNLQKVILTAFFGTMIFEQCIFFVGRLFGDRIMGRFPKLQASADKAFCFLKKYDILFIFSFRFVYGIRNVSPIVIGMSGISPLKFSSCNIPASLIWASSVAYAGYIFSDTIQVVIDNIKHFSIALFGFLLAFAGVFFVMKARK